MPADHRPILSDLNWGAFQGSPMSDPGISPPETPLSPGDKARVAVRLILFGLVAAVVVAMFLAPQGDPIKPGGAAPETVARSYNGQTWHLHDHFGKPMLIKFWGTWCAPCVRELPLLSKVAKESRGKLELIGFAVDSPSDEVAAMVKRFDLQYTIATVDRATQKRWRADFLPTTYLLDAKGNVVWNAAGMVDEKTLREALKTHTGVSF
jgi:thiol-disulfide isomerase/thioredoxin